MYSCSFARVRFYSPFPRHILIVSLFFSTLLQSEIKSVGINLTSEFPVLSYLGKASADVLNILSVSVGVICVTCGCKGTLRFSAVEA